MFEVGFSELVLIGLVALIVIGPERLPRVAREAGLWLRKARSLVSSVKQEIDHELQLQDLKQSLLKHDSSDELKAPSDTSAKEIVASRRRALTESQATDTNRVHEEKQSR
jgi:sec-independent protein translocase protein TatB